MLLILLFVLITRYMFLFGVNPEMDKISYLITLYGLQVFELVFFVLSLAMFAYIKWNKKDGTYYPLIFYFGCNVLLYAYLKLCSAWNDCFLKNREE